MVINPEFFYSLRRCHNRIGWSIGRQLDQGFTLATYFLGSLRRPQWRHFGNITSPRWLTDTSS